MKCVMEMLHSSIKKNKAIDINCLKISAISEEKYLLVK